MPTLRASLARCLLSLAAAGCSSGAALVADAGSHDAGSTPKSGPDAHVADAPREAANHHDSARDVGAHDAGAQATIDAPPHDASHDAATGDGSLNLLGWNLVWSDEFNGIALDTTVWNATPSGQGGYNQELQYFNGPESTSVSGGYLHIAATTLPPDAGLTCWYGPCRYNSAQLDTSGKFSHQYGRFAARMKIPAGAAFWPAFWMLGNQMQWPASGEIDVMENVGDTPATDYGTIHGPNGSAAYAVGGSTKLASGSLSDGFHVYAVEWSAAKIDWYLDNLLYFTATPASLDGGDVWAYTQPFYLLFDLAIGGDWPGDPDAGIPEPSELLVDWVRVYDPM
jgi:beta-glucanase (GH16 family)